tara:strand:+ start:126 stop:1544 length:1419 start_codon:yes stop_codon:yes gene_type:complete
MALYDRRFGLPQAVVDYLNQGLPNIYQSITQPSIAPTTTQPVVNTDQDIIENLYPKIGGGGDSYSVYNPDPSTISNREYSPYAYRQAAERNLIGTPGGSLTGTNIPNTSTEVAKLMDMYPDYYQGKQLTGIPGAAANYLQNSYIGKGLDYLGNIMPVNRRAIYENELAGQGIMVNDIGQIVSDGGNINTAQNIMAGYNANKIDASTIQNRIDTINEKMKDPDQKKAKLDALYEFAKINNIALDRTTSIFDDQSLQKDPTYKNLDQLIEEGLLEGDDDDDNDDYDPTDPENFFKFDPISRKSAIDQEISNRNAEREIAKRKAIRESSIDQEISNREAARKKSIGPSYSGMGSIGSGGSNRSSGPSYSGMGSIGSGGSNRSSGPSSGTGRGATSATSSGLGGFGFSDIRLKENVELIGKSPSNINIYKFNYKNNPTTYQGAMAHEVPWASVKHSNGYMMVDYNLLDVDFKKYNA